MLFGHTYQMSVLMNKPTSGLQQLLLQQRPLDFENNTFQSRVTIMLKVPLLMLNS